ncbi:MAG: hypothetical protein HYZ53_23730 [Planctomycetes bacterium]|nr:hypothetical protein [Planctomycetota bacterium]
MTAFGITLFAYGLCQFFAFLALPLPSILLPLLVGLPLGGVLAARRDTDESDGLERALLSLQVAMGAALFATLFHRKIIPVEPPIYAEDFVAPALARSLGCVAVQLVLFGPFFVAAGAAGLRALRAVIDACGHTPGAPVAALAPALCGIAAACGLRLVGLETFGLVPVVLVGVVAVGVARAATAPSSRAQAVRAGLVLALAFVPSLDRQVLRFAMPGEADAVRGWIRSRASGAEESFAELVEERWLRHHYLATLRYGRGRDFAGLLDGRLTCESRSKRGWSPNGELAVWWAARGELPILAIGGSLYSKLRFGEHGGLAIAELVGAAFGNSWLWTMGGRQGRFDEDLYPRRYLEQRDARRGLIAVDRIETAPASGWPLLVEPDWLHTEEAMRLLAGRRTDAGLLVLIESSLLDPEGRFARRCLWTLENIGESAVGWVRDRETDAVAVDSSPRGMWFPPGASAFLIAVGRGESTFRPRTAEAALELESHGFLPLRDPAPGGFEPLRDDRPFPGVGLPGRPGVGALWGLLLGGLAVLGVALAVCVTHVRRRVAGAWAAGLLEVGDPDAARAERGGMAVFAAVSAFAGLGLVLLLFVATYRWMRVANDPLDAMQLGPVWVALALACGCALRERGARRATVFAVAACLLDFVGVFPRENASGVALALVPAVAGGAFLPTLLGRARTQNALAFVGGGVGATAGFLVAATLPVLWGFRAYDRVADTAFLIALAVVAGWRRAGRGGAVAALGGRTGRCEAGGATPREQS